MNENRKLIMRKASKRYYLRNRQAILDKARAKYAANPDVRQRMINYAIQYQQEHKP